MITTTWLTKLSLTSHYLKSDLAAMLSQNFLVKNYLIEFIWLILSHHMSVCTAMVMLSMMTMTKTIHCAIFWSETIFLLVWETAMPSCRRATFSFLIKSYQPQKGLVNRDISRKSWFNMRGDNEYLFFLGTFRMHLLWFVYVRRAWSNSAIVR